MNKITLYVNSNWRRVGIHSPLLNPWWGNPNEETSLFAKETFDSYPLDTSLYAITNDITKADMVLPPYRHAWFLRHDPALFEECIRTAKEANLPLLIDGVGDIEYPLVIENAYILRIGGYRFLPEKGRIQIPPAVDDLLERCCGGELQIRKKSGQKPVVGFAGWAQLTSIQKLRTILKEFPVRLRGLFDSRYRAMTKGVLWRARALNILKHSPLVILNLKKRSSFSGSAKTAEKDLRTLRQEFVDTVLCSDYCLDVRGDANDSGRLFEILSLGRIPVMIDTERPLPFTDEIDYREFMLIVDHQNIQKLPQIIAEFHERVSPEKYEDMQRLARQVFVRHLRTDAWMRHIIKQLPPVKVKI